MRIGFSGHRDFDNAVLAARWVDGIATRHPGAEIITGGAVGADLIIAEQVVKNDKLKSLVILPMLPHIFTALWSPQLATRLDSVLQKSDIYLMSEYSEVTYEQLCELDYACADAETSKYEPEFLTERNEEIVDNSDFLVAFWDSRQSGGTFNAVQTALEKGIDVYQGFPWTRTCGKKSINSFALIEKDEPLADFFKTEEPCIEGFERLQAKIGYTNFSFYPLSADRYASNGSVFERHDDFSITFREEPLAPSNSLIATLKATLNVDSENATDIARMIEEAGIEHKDYFVAQYKKNPFAALQELEFLSDGMSDLQENPNDVMSRVNVENATLVQSFNDDPSEDTFDDEEFDDEYHVVNDPSTAWHRLDVDDSRTFIDPSLPLPPEKKNPVFVALLEKAQTRTPAAGKEIYALSKSGKVKLSYDQWNQVWAEYKGKESPRLGSRGILHHTALKHPELFNLPLSVPPPPDYPTRPIDLNELNPVEPQTTRPTSVRYRRVNPESERARQAKKLFCPKTQPKPIAFTSEPYKFVRSEKVFRPTAICVNETRRLPRIIEVDLIKPQLFDVSNPARYPAMMRISA